MEHGLIATLYPLLEPVDPAELAAHLLAELSPPGQVPLSGCSKTLAVTVAYVEAQLQRRPHYSQQLQAEQIGYLQNFIWSRGNRCDCMFLTSMLWPVLAAVAAATPAAEPAPAPDLPGRGRR